MDRSHAAVLGGGLRMPQPTLHTEKSQMDCITFRVPKHGMNALMASVFEPDPRVGVGRPAIKTFPLSCLPVCRRLSPAVCVAVVSVVVVVCLSACVVAVCVATFVGEFVRACVRACLHG